MKSNRWTAKDIAEENARNRDVIENLTAELAALKEESERLKQPTGHFTNLLEENDRLRARVAELERYNARLRSAGSPMANAFYNIAQGSTTEMRAQQCVDLYKNWDIAVKVEEPANEG